MNSNFWLLQLTQILWMGGQFSNHHNFLKSFFFGVIIIFLADFVINKNGRSEEHWKLLHISMVLSLWTETWGHYFKKHQTLITVTRDLIVSGDDSNTDKTHSYKTTKNLNKICFYYTLFSIPTKVKLI